MGELKDSMAEKHIELIFDASLLEYLTQKSYSEKYGARNLRRLIQKEIEDKIAEEMISGYASAYKQVGLTAVKGEVQVIAV